MINLAFITRLALTGVLLLPGCSALNELQIQPEQIQSLQKILPQIPQQKVQIEFINQLPNSQYVPLVPSSIEYIIFNKIFRREASDFPPNQGLKEVLPFIEAGEHLLEVKFKLLENPIHIPVIVEERQSEQLNILVILSFSSAGNNLQDIQVGYDQDLDQTLDPDHDIYRSQSGDHYNIHHPDGSVGEWRYAMNKTETASSSEDQAPVPAGAETSLSANTEGQPPPQPNETDPAPPPIEPPEIPMPQPLPAP